MKCYRSLPFFCLLLMSYAGRGQDFSNKGKEFFIAYPSHIDGINSVMGLYITSAVDTKGTVLLGSGTPLSFTVQANVVTRVFLGSGSGTNTPSVYYGSNGAVYLAGITDGIQSSSAIRINTDDAVVVYAHIIRQARSGATLVLPTQVLGNEYVVANINSTSTSNATSNGSMGGRSEIVVVATQANTTVEIKPSIAVGAHAAGVAYTVTLPNAGDCYQLQSANLQDLSGTRVSSKSVAGSTCKPIAVYSASTWSTFDCSNSSGGDNLFQQLFPVGTWGKTFVTAPFYNRTDDIFRIFVKDAQTVVQVQESGVVSTLGSSSYNSTGGFYSYRTANPIVITASNPISVAQYITSASCKTGCLNNTSTPNCYGDPEMVLLNPVEQTLQDITFFSAHSAYVPQGQTQIQNHYVNIIISKSFKSTVKIDGAAPQGSFVDITNTNYSYLQENITVSSAGNPVHRVTADTNFAAIVYGYGNVESYGYNAGTNVKDFSATTSFQNPFKRIDSAVTCTNTPFQFSVPLTFQPLSIVWDYSAAPNISPSANVTPAVPVFDSISRGLYYYGPGQTYTFSKPSTAALRDTIKLYTTSATPDGCGSTSQLFTIPVKVNETPVANFSFVHSGCVSDSVRFVDKTLYSGTIGQYVWDFGDGSTEIRTSPDTFAKKYTNAGSYTIKLRAIADIGCASTDTSHIISMNSKPVARFNLPSLVCQNTETTFTDASTTAVGSIVKWIWDLNDGKGGFINTTSAAVKATYTDYGNKHPALQVETSNGCKSDIYEPGIIVNPAPQPGFILPEVCLNDASAVFTDSSKIAEGSIASWAWNFNAGTPPVSPGPSITTSTAQNPSVKYNKSDYYKVSLTVTSALGCVANLSQDFTVNGSIPKAVFDFANTAPYCGIKPVQLKNQSTVDFGNVTKLEIYWDFANAPTLKETIETPVSNGIYPHSYPDPSAPKQYTIRMVAYSGGNTCVSETSKTITVYPQPKAAYTVSATEICDGETVKFTDKSSTGSSAAASWVWDLGKGISSSLQNPSKLYNDSGLINTSMYFYNQDGCISDTARQALTVYPNPQVVLKHKTVMLEGAVTTLKPEWVYGHNLQYLWTPASFLSSDTAMAPKATPDNDITYKLIVTAEGGCTASDTIFIRVLKSPEVPNAFSPNGDGINDTWFIKYLDGYPGATVDVYDRGGQIVFHTVGYDVAWDGNYKGKALPVGTYYYIINPRNGKPVISGSVTIIK
jgi:gliding motility-associated-like protein